MTGKREIYLAGGCFWGMERYLASIPGVVETQVGYANGTGEEPTYEQVCHHDTGHAETVRVTYDPERLSLSYLLELYEEAIDPLAVDRQGADTGPQYRTGVYYTDPADAPAVARSLQELSRRLGQPTAVECGPLQNFWPAEEYHQKYLEKNPGGYCHIPPQKFASASRSAVDPSRYAPPDEEELRERLTSEQYAVTRRGATEPPFQNEFWDERRPGIYVDVTTGEPLFASCDKFSSGCGWPSFTAPIDPHALRELEDDSHGMNRTEVRSRVGNAHLGHVFEDGPAERGGLRYCINSAALRFIPREDMEREGYGALVPLAK